MKKSFKTETLRGSYAIMSTKSLTTTEISTQSKMILTLLRLHAGRDMVVSERVTPRSINDCFGYHPNKIRESLNELNLIGYIDIEDVSSRNKKITITCKKNPKKYERFTMLFVYSKRLSTRDKEFIMLISPYVNLVSDVIPLSDAEIAKKIGYSESTVRNHIYSLKSLGYWTDFDGRRNLYMLAIMTDASADSIEEVYRLKETVQVKDQIIKHQRIQINELNNKLKKYENE